MFPGSSRVLLDAPWCLLDAPGCSWVLLGAHFARTWHNLARYMCHRRATCSLLGVGTNPLGRLALNLGRLAHTSIKGYYPKPGTFGTCWGGTGSGSSKSVARSSWVLLGVPGCSWVFLGAPGCSWVFLGVSWLLLAVPGCSWLLLALPGSCWLLLGARGRTWLLLAAVDYSLLLLAAPGCSWLLLKVQIDPQASELDL